MAIKTPISVSIDRIMALIAGEYSGLIMPKPEITAAVAVAILTPLSYLKTIKIFCNSLIL